MLPRQEFQEAAVETIDPASHASCDLVLNGAPGSNGVHAHQRVELENVCEDEIVTFQINALDQPSKSPNVEMLAGLSGICGRHARGRAMAVSDHEPDNVCSKQKQE